MTSYSETGTSSVDYFDDLISEGEQAAQEQEQAVIASDLTPKENWVNCIIEGMELAGGMTGQTWLILPNSEVSKEQMERILSADYDLILKHPRFHFLIKPSGSMMETLMLLAGNVAVAGGLIRAAKAFNADKIKPKKSKSQKFEDTTPQHQAPEEPQTHGAMSPEDANNLFNGGKLNG